MKKKLLSAGALIAALWLLALTVMLCRLAGQAPAEDDSAWLTPWRM